MWPPETPPELLPGRSARFWMKIVGAGIPVGLVFLVLIPVGSMLAPPLRDLVVFGSLGVVVVVGGVGLWASAMSRLAIDREHDDGYTTLFGIYRELWQLDDRTGEVLRRPGEREVSAGALAGMHRPVRS